MTLFEEQAVRKARRLRIALIGPSGSGKTKTALRMAEGLVQPGQRVALLDTEHRSSELYADQHTFFPAYMEAPYSPQRYIGVIAKARERGDIGVLIIDSGSHAWMGKGGVLEQVDALAGPRGTDTRNAWKQMTPIQQELVEAIIGAPFHVIVTLRTKDAYGQDERGKRVKVGLAPVQREGLDYEMDVVLYLDQQHVATVDKSRIPDVMPVGATCTKPGENESRALAEWLASGSGDGGADPVPLGETNSPTHSAASDASSSAPAGGPSPTTGPADQANVSGATDAALDPFTGEPVAALASNGKPEERAPATDAVTALRQLIDAKRNELVALTPTHDDAYWRQKVEDRSQEWYGHGYAELTADQLADLAQRLEQTRLALAARA